MRKRSFVTALVILIVAAVCNAPLTYRIGVNGIVYQKKIPLYAKACGFLYRDWMYRDIVRGIIGNRTTDEEKALAVLKWTDENIKRGIPPGLKALDDHPLNIIIRQYGMDDQLEDVFTILCSYAGMYGGMEKCYDEKRTKFVVLSFVKVGDGRWLIFDVSKNKYFLNQKGGIASVGDYLGGRLVLSGKDREEYGEFLEDIKNINFSSLTRAGEQMPLKRFQIELMKLFRKNNDKAHFSLHE